MDHTIVPNAPLRIDVESVPPVLVITLQGELDAGCAGLVRDITLGDLSHTTFIVVDLAPLTFSDSTGMRALLDLRAGNQTPDREVRIVNACPLIQRLCSLMGEEHAVSA